MYPHVDETKCVQCSLCQKQCPVNSPLIKNAISKDIMSAWSSNDDERISSSSGGVFPEIAKQILQKRGVVYGAAFDEHHNIKHIRIDSLSQLCLLKGSKYYQSDIRKCFFSVRDDLNKGRKVLFSGTGCQIAAIKRFIEDLNTELLITVEIVCHGVPSKKVVDSCIKSVNNKSTPKKIVFRDKSRYGWEYSCVFNIEFEDGKQHYGRSSTDLFYLGFLTELFLRESCYSCPYVGKERIGDITLADYWGITKNQVLELTEKDLVKGVSLVLTNSERGRQMMNQLVETGFIIRHEADLDTAAIHNQALKGNYIRPPKRDNFFVLNEKYGYRIAMLKLYPKTVIGIKIRSCIKKVIGEKKYNQIKAKILKG